MLDFGPPCRPASLFAKRPYFGLCDKPIALRPAPFSLHSSASPFSLDFFFVRIHTLQLELYLN
ncbi:hypothetical protein PGT21_011319 [Puccinia graminis f. sp. tritici]|uniref:Uncharacterized protein n=1 Tax=Puccinia graminis f. sp. tritici TaxID=56615 RepID=A0A5B0R0D7_PUCGR|nr:hypothetical protein PGT21_011319 [Puccinia graminis f. sp. tritici]